MTSQPASHYNKAAKPRRPAPTRPACAVATGAAPEIATLLALLETAESDEVKADDCELILLDALERAELADALALDKTDALPEADEAALDKAELMLDRALDNEAVACDAMDDADA